MLHGEALAHMLSSQSRSPDPNTEMKVILNYQQRRAALYNGQSQAIIPLSCLELQDHEAMT